ncbi:Protein of unknown function [Gryllus bimaculatus]|nr:Protein of unknown function [Gryllus bimaculatus]
MSSKLVTLGSERTRRERVVRFEGHYSVHCTGRHWFTVREVESWASFWLVCDNFQTRLTLWVDLVIRHFKFARQPYPEQSVEIHFFQGVNFRRTLDSLQLNIRILRIK